MKTTGETCPVCKAPAGDPCLSETTNSEMERVHYARVPADRVFCPACSAEKGKPCFDVGRRSTSGYHAARIMDAEQHLQEKM